MERIKGSNKHGNLNEVNIVNALNERLYKDLNTNLKTFISSICIDNNISLYNDTIIKSEREVNDKIKPDIYIYIGNKKISVSCKMGTGNSVHQEKIDGFCDYLKLKLNASEDICNYFKLFIWADGTYNGSGSIFKNEEEIIISRFSAIEFKNIYPLERNELLKFIKVNQVQLLKRFLFEGIHNSSVDYVYHGTEHEAVRLTQKEIIDFNINNSKLNSINPRSALPCGRLTLQAWNISKNGKNEMKRGEIQAKYSNMKEDFHYLMKEKSKNLGTFYGDIDEYELSRKLNKDKYSALWRTLLPDETDFSNKFLVKVSTNQKSKLNNKLSKAKSDAYVIEANISHQYLLDKAYIITENDLKNINYFTITKTGISIKRSDSNNFTYQKLGVKSFLAIFSHLLDEPLYYFAGMLLYTKENMALENEIILEKLGLTKNEFFNYFDNKIDNDILENNDSLIYISIKRYSSQEIKKIIENNKYVNAIVFKGENNFQEPYIAHFIYANGKLRENIINKFYLTTGSGRSKGIYTIVIKP